MDIEPTPTETPTGQPDGLGQPENFQNASSAATWDQILIKFLQNSGLNEAKKGFELDMLVLNEAHEKTTIHEALAELVRDLGETAKAVSTSEASSLALSERKLNYVGDVVQPNTPTSMNRSIARFLAANRARLNRSNREEFLRPRKRRRADDTADSDLDDSTCARTDAIRVNREAQMKYDIVKNVDGPLGKTMQGSSGAMETAEGQGRGGLKLPKYQTDPNMPTLDRHTGLDERFRSTEEHLAVRYVPGPPEDIRLRLKYIEEHIIRLERDYPPWAALHFNQPRRGWLPPPRPTPIIVPAHLTAAVEPPPRPAPVPPPVSLPVPASQPLFAASPVAPAQPPKRKRARGQGRAATSLTMAVMEKLDMQNASRDSS